MCHECHRRQTQDFLRAAVQVRQKTSHKKTFLYLEQLILKHRVHVSALKVKETSDGLDFFFAQKQEARKLVDFLQTVVPCRYKTSQELVSHDIHSNTFQYKHTFSVELVPVCKVLVFFCKSTKLPTANTACVLLTAVAELSSSVYWRTPFSSLCNHRQLTEFYVLHIEKATPPGSHGNSSANHSDKCVLSDVWVVPVSELGTSDRQIHCRSHLGHLLHDGDCMWGFDLSQANLNDANLDKMNPADILMCCERAQVLVKKSYGDKVNRSKQRNWQLQMIDREMDVTVATTNEKGAEEDYEEFLEDLEEDMIYRKNVNIFFTAAFYYDNSYTANKPNQSLQLCILLSRRECSGVDIHMYFFVCRFDLSQANLNDANLDKMNPADIPDVVLVKKSYGDKVKRSKQRNWQLQMMDREMDVTVATTNEKGAEEDYEEFLEDLEEDMIYRKNVNIFFSPGEEELRRQGQEVETEELAAADDGPGDGCYRGDDQ
ncbi:60S ribosomal export protein NMD3 [Geodia barretti]|uniref:60S ribosomal export protein NMD3 n=1 Tax=Geodia barretti TaxID=519541 RepID=A0AA35RT64_GEOBA|nr:60S ribosomal export protein NMD3 [Geodia barretti]